MAGVGRSLLSGAPRGRRSDEPRKRPRGPRKSSRPRPCGAHRQPQEASMRSFLLATTLLLLNGAVAHAQDQKAHATSADAVQWGAAPSVLPKGAQAAVLAGDPGKTGPF